MSDKIRIGIIGAGTNTRERHIPNLKAQPGVELVSVCNRSLESSQKVAKDFSIPRVHKDWRELVRSEEIDAVVIGTWPYLHCPVTLESLAAGKHVLTEARMAMNAAEARLMLRASRQNPHLITQVVPSPFTFQIDATLGNLLSQGFLGELQALDVRGNSPSFADRDGALHWRHDRDLSGLNIMGMGIWYEAVMRWVGEAHTVMAMAQVNVKQRKDSDGRLRAVSVPDHVDILANMVCGAQAHFQFSTVTGLSSGPEVWLYGSEGTLCYRGADARLLAGRRGDSSLTEVSIRQELVGGWRVEEEFVNSIRGEEKVRLTTFEDGLKYMQFTEAVSRSACSGTAVFVQEM